MSVYDGMAFQVGRILGEVALAFGLLLFVLGLTAALIVYSRLRNGSR